MENPETRETFDTQDTGRRQTKQRTHHNTENKKDEQHRPHQKTDCEPSCSRRVNASCFLRNTRHVTHAVKSCRTSLHGNKHIQQLRVKTNGHRFYGGITTHN